MYFTARGPYENYQLEINLTEFSSLVKKRWADLWICLRETDFVGQVYQSNKILKVTNWTSFFFLHTYNILLKEIFTKLKAKDREIYKKRGKDVEEK